MDTGDWIAIGTAGLSAFLASWALYVSMRHARYGYLAGLMEDYGGRKMRDAVATLHEFFTRQGEDADTVRAEFARMLKKARADGKPSAECDNLDNARRDVSHFYQRMAALYRGDLLPAKVLYCIWSTKNLDIIPKIIVPLEEALYVHLHGKEHTNEFDYLIDLYNGSPKQSRATTKKA